MNFTRRSVWPALRSKASGNLWYRSYRAGDLGEEPLTPDTDVVPPAAVCNPRLPRLTRPINKADSTRPVFSLGVATRAKVWRHLAIFVFAPGLRSRKLTPSGSSLLQPGIPRLA